MTHERIQQDGAVRQPRRFVIPLPKPESLPFPFPAQIDSSGHVNYSTVALVRDPNFRETVREGRRKSGLGSAFIIDPQGTWEAAIQKGFVDKLTPTQREIMELRFNHGLTQAEVSVITGKDFRAVSKVERSGLRRLNKSLEGERFRRERKNARVMLNGGYIDLSLLDFLTDTQREILQLRYVERLSTEEAAKRSRRKPKNVNEIENAALDKLVIELREVKKQH